MDYMNTTKKEKTYKIHLNDEKLLRAIDIISYNKAMANFHFVMPILREDKDIKNIMKGINNKPYKDLVKPKLKNIPIFIKDHTLLDQTIYIKDELLWKAIKIESLNTGKSKSDVLKDILRKNNDIQNFETATKSNIEFYKKILDDYNNNDKESLLNKEGLKKYFYITKVAEAIVKKWNLTEKNTDRVNSILDSIIEDDPWIKATKEYNKKLKMEIYRVIYNKLNKIENRR